jgi:outer membrane protein assembly factor BamA
LVAVFSWLFFVSGATQATEAANKLLTSSAVPGGEETEVKDQFDWVALPVPIRNPTVGTGLALAAMVTYSLDDNSPESSTAVFGGRTDNQSWAAGFKQSAFWSDDRFRFDLVAGRGEANLKYFGREDGIDLSDNPINYSLTGSFVQPRLSVRAADRWFVGLQGTYLDAKTGLSLGSIIPPVELDTQLVGLGPLVTFDSRDNRFYPRTGTYAELIALRYDDRWGSDFEYNKYPFFANRYVPVTSSTTLAMRVNGVLTDGNVPFFDAPSLTLRGFPAGRYQNEQMIAAEAEARWRFHDRWTLVGILGAGKVAPKLNAFGDAKTVVSKGLGIRFLASQKSQVNIGIDYAAGPDDNAIYFRVGEAF